MNPLTEKQLDFYVQNFPQESATVQATKKFLAHVEKKEKTRDQLSGSAWIFNPTNGKILLTHHKKMNKWVQPGGHAEKTEIDQLHKAALREATEETGIQTLTLYNKDLFHLSIFLNNNAAEPYYLHDFCFLFVTEETQYQPSNEANDLRWVSTAAILADKQYQSVALLAKKWQMFCYLQQDHLVT